MNGKVLVLLVLVTCLPFTGQACCVNPQMGSLKAAYGLHLNSCVLCDDLNTKKDKQLCWADRFYTNAPGSRELCDPCTMDTHHCMAEVFINNAPDPPFSPLLKRMIHAEFPCPIIQGQDQCLYITGSAPFYHDKSYNKNGLASFYANHPLSQEGKDTDATDGIDTTMLFFHVGHGEEGTCASWSTAAHRLCSDCPNNWAHLKYMKLGNCKTCDMGMLRYFWQCACLQFAHGPNSTGDVNHPNYPSPQYYDGSNDSPAMRNVYERWGPVLGKDLRMACGVSTLAYCDGEAAAAIWDYYSGGNYAVADAFIMGLRDEALQEHGEDVIPLCIASGGRFLSNSPLIKDERFTNLPNEDPVPRTHLYIQFLQKFRSNPPFSMVLPPPDWADIFRLKIPRRLPPIDHIEFKAPKPPHPDPPIMISTQPDADFGLSVRENPVSGAVYFSGKQKFDPEPPKLSEAEYINRAVRFINHFGLTETSADDPNGIRMMLQSTPLESKGKTISHAQKNVIVTFKRHIVVDGRPVTVLGDGGKMQVQMNNDGSIINASKVWREIDGVVKRARVKTYDEAYKEAVKSLKDPEAYHLARWTWGYKELSGSVKQEEMRVVYRFYFWPKKPGPPYAPARIEILAQSP